MEFPFYLLSMPVVRQDFGFLLTLSIDQHDTTYHRRQKCMTMTPYASLYP